ncbi:MAG: hypothetical protein J6T74_06065 [Clostridia bacterium]|nr:hypothetical protein [Clostridia bacterium]
MLDKKEKFVVLYLNEICPEKRSYLVLAQDIAEFVSKKYLISTSELDDIMTMLSKENYIDFVVSDSKKGYYYCITLKGKARTFKKDILRKRKELIFAIGRTLAFALLSFVVGIILKKIFKG